MEKVIHSYVSNLRREKTSETKIYELLDELHPHLGNPLTFYEEFVIKYDEGYKKAKKAQKKAEREAEMLAARAMTELANKRKCHELEQVTRNQQSQASELTTASMKLKQNSLHNDVTLVAMSMCHPIYYLLESVPLEAMDLSLLSTVTAFFAC
jgi:hypothetical protein